jgi:primosomal protein N' (replication factor Y)
MSHFVNVILPLPLEKQFTYFITEDQKKALQPGMRVAVPFGKTKVYTGVAVEIHREKPMVYQAKPLEQILDKEPTVTEKQLKFWIWAADYYMCALGQVMKAALPSALLLESETVVELNEEGKTNTDNLTDEEYLVFEALQNKSLLKIHEVMDILDKKNILPILNSLVEKDAVIVNQELNKKYTPKLIKYVRFRVKQKEQDLNALMEELTAAPKQKELVLAYYSLNAKTKKPIESKQLIKEANTSRSVYKGLLKKGVFEEYSIKVDRVNYAGNEEGYELNLSDEQQTAFDEIQASFQKEKPVLLHGITSSGKTEIYLRLMEDAVKNDRQVLFLLPEIALTTQLIQRLQDYFGQEVLIYHSKYSLNERVEVYEHIKNQTKGRIIVGTRSAILLPYQNLGVIIVDESHETSYKQFDPAPRYHARDLAVVLSHFHNSKLILGSATPSLESYFNTRNDKYDLVSLDKRYGNVLPPEINLVDLKDKHKRKKMTGHFSDDLIKQIEVTLKEGKQVILFQNRRGFSPILECHTCGHSPQCPNCDVSLTYHKRNNSLRCHYCGYKIAMQYQCMACGSAELTTKGFGTEQIQNEAQEIFENHTIKRMDRDTTRGKYGYEKIINAFEQQQIDILIGTQMVTKGLDFRNVDLVGVLNADSLLNFPDFRAHERCFQLLVQVAGRAGRTKKQGQVLIQTYNPGHRILQQVTQNDYEPMFKEQLYDRRNFNYPPFYRLIKITMRSRDFNKVNESSEWMATALRKGLGKNILGPEFPAVARIRNQYNKNIMVKIEPEQSISKTKTYLKRVVKSFQAVGSFRSVRIILNVDPY